MKLKVKPFGKGGLHIITPKKHGFKEGEVIEVKRDFEATELTEERVKQMIKKEIEKATRY